MSRYNGTRPAGKAQSVRDIHRGVRGPVKPFIPECPQMTQVREPPENQTGYDPFRMQQGYRRYNPVRR